MLVPLALDFLLMCHYIISFHEFQLSFIFGQKPMQNTTLFYKCLIYYSYKQKGANNMSCNRSRNDNCCEPVKTQYYNCNADRHVIKHHHVVKHKHDIINEYDIVHEHEYNYYDVVRNRDVVKRNDYTNHRPNYCCEDKKQDCNCERC
jgi:hypothetical protein